MEYEQYQLSQLVNDIAPSKATLLAYMKERSAGKKIDTLLLKKHPRIYAEIRSMLQAFRDYRDRAYGKNKPIPYILVSTESIGFKLGSFPINGTDPLWDELNLFMEELEGIISEDDSILHKRVFYEQREEYREEISSICHLMSLWREFDLYR